MTTYKILMSETTIKEGIEIEVITILSPYNNKIKHENFTIPKH